MRETADTDPLYRRLADELATAVRAGSLRPGQRLPSIRALSRQRQVSVSSVLGALRWLEREGWVEARPRSGYFVRPRPAAAMGVPPAAATIPLEGTAERVYRIFKAGVEQDLVPLAAAFPGPSLYPHKALARHLQQVVRQRPEVLTTYLENPIGEPALRQQIARRTVALGCPLGADELIITNGCTEAVNLALQLVTQAGDVVAVESPTYFGIHQILESLRLRVLELPTDPIEGVSLDALEAATRVPGAVKACVLVPNFSNPLGAVIPDARKAAIVDLLAGREVALIEDDVFGDLCHSGPRPAFMKQWDTRGRVMTCGSLSKALAPGMRIGWLVPGRYLHPARLLKAQRTVSTAAAPQLALAAYLDGGGFERHLGRLRPRLARQVAQMAEAVRRRFPPGTVVGEPRGGFLLWVRLPGPVDGDVLSERALAAGIAVAQGSLFSATDEARYCIRLNCGHLWTARIDQAITTLARLAAG